MQKDINEDILLSQKEKLIDDKIEELIKSNPGLIKENKILEVEYNLDGSKKDLYSLASERDIKETQIKSDVNEIEYKFYQKLINKEEYEVKKKELEEKLRLQNEVYNDLIFKIINNVDLEELKSDIKKYNLNEIDLKRLASAITSVIDAKVEEFIQNNKEFMINKVKYWNYKYSELSKAISKSREVENFILSLIEN